MNNELALLRHQDHQQRLETQEYALENSLENMYRELSMLLKKIRMAETSLSICKKNISGVKQIIFNFENEKIGVC